MVGWPQVSFTDFDNICEYLFFSQFDPQMELNFTARPFDKAYCGAWLNGYVYEMCLALDIEWQLVSYEYMAQLGEFAQFLSG